MLAVPLALQLRDHGLRWVPAPGDRFILPHRDMDDEAFVLSDMTVQVYEFPNATVIGFNGVTEWALDSIEQSEALWLPSETQLRTLLGGLFLQLVATPVGFVVAVSPAGTAESDGTDGTQQTQFAASAEDAYGLALLAVLKSL